MPVLRSVKNIVKNYTDAEVKVREATSNDPWGPSSTLMTEIADLTYNVVAFTEIMQMVWKRLNDHGKNWRHVYKSLTLLEYIMKTGSEKVALQCKENIFAIQTLKDFQHLEDNKDLGANVREKAKGLVALLKDDDRLKNERAKALKAKERFTENFGIGSDSSSTQLGRPRPKHTTASTDTALRSALANPELEEARPHSAGEEELQLQLALAMSKEEADNDAKKKTNDDLKLQLALEESKKEEPVNNEHLLDFAGGGSAAAPASDPWNPAPQLQVSADPWGTSAAVPAASTTVNSASPFSPITATSSTDPWSSSSTAPAAAGNPPGNPWDAPSASNDPWDSSSTAAVSTSSPWDTGFSNGSSPNPHKPVTIDDDFDVLGKRTAPSFQPAPAGSSDLFDMQSVQSTLPPLQPMGQTSLVAAGPKKPEDFLDNESKDLVNLDSLITKPSSATGVVNPFALTSMGANGSASASSNPFTAQQPPPPSLKEMSTTNQMTGFSNGVPMVNPMVPMAFPMGGYNSGPVQQPMFQQQQQQPQPHAGNPFL